MSRWSAVALLVVGLAACGGGGKKERPPEAPVGVTAEAGVRSAIVTWTPGPTGTAGAATSFRVKASPGGATENATGTSATVTGLDDGTRYTFTVTASNGAGSSAPSAPSPAVTTPAVPAAPENVRALMGEVTVSLSWSAPSSDGGRPLTGYTVVPMPAAASAVFEVQGTNATVSGLGRGTSYTFQVTATNAVGTGPASAPSGAVTTPDVPGAPTAVNAVASDGAAVITWIAPVSDGGRPLTAYTLLLTPTQPSAIVEITGTRATVTGLANLTSYEFRVVARNVVGAGPESQPSPSVMPMPNRPPVVSVAPVTPEVGQYALVDASSTRDPDGDPITFAWTLTSKPQGSGAVLFDADTAKPSFRADVRGTYNLQLVASDGVRSTTVPVPVASGDFVSLPEAKTISVSPGTAVRFVARCPLEGAVEDWQSDGSLWPFADASFTYYSTGTHYASYSCRSVLTNQTASASRTIVVRPPASAIVVSPAYPVRQLGGLPVTFAATRAALPTSVAWSINPPFGTLSTASGTSVVYTPPTSGPPASGVPPGVVKLTATDGTTSVVITILLTARPPPNRPPEPRIAAIPGAVVGKVITLDGTGSSDPDGDAMTFTWAVSSRPVGSVATIAAPGEIRTSFVPDVPGTYELKLAVVDPRGASAVATSSFVGSAPPASIAAVSAEHQVSAAGKPVADPPVVVVRDAAGQPVAGTAVTFEVAGGGTLTAASAVTGADGRAGVASWTLGTTGLQVVNARVTEDPSLVFTFTATPRAAAEGYDITLQYMTTASDAVVRAFTRARARVEGMITGELPNVYLNTGYLASCAGLSITGTVDDLYIAVLVQDIDGPGGILGQAGPCMIRTSSRLPVFGVMKFDAADLAAMLADGTLDSVIQHEMLHVVGFGSMWTDLGLLYGSGGTDPYFLGSQARSAFLDYNGGTTYAGTAVPVENTGGTGTANSHWRETVFGRELMTGWIGGAVNPLSRTTIGSLADMGYLVNLGVADAYDIRTGMRAFETEPAVPIEEELMTPAYEVGEAGAAVPIAR
ncbi:MAG: fibronectin type III domain-containing protein [Anaeromyxobacteraceae bacterium]